MTQSKTIEVSVPGEVWDDLRARLARTRWPDGDFLSHSERNWPSGWDLGVDLGYLRELCAYWAEGYDPARLPSLVNRFDNYHRDGIHFIRERPSQPSGAAPGAERRPAPCGGDRLPLMLLHGWPGGPIEYLEVIPRLTEAGHEVVVPSLPGYAWSDDPNAPLNIAAVAARLRELAQEGLGWERFGVVGGDWGAPIAARMAFDSQRVAALYVFTPGTLPPSAQLADPPLGEAEQAFIEEGMRWRRREGHHLLLQSTVPDIVAVGLNDSPAGLAAYLLEKYRRWSDCGGEVERRFSRDQLCDYLTMYWSTGTIASSMRLYRGERDDRWRPGEGDAIEAPAAVGVFPAEIINPPREWTERLLTGLRRWTEMPRGGHFAAHEEPVLLADDVLAFVSGL